jgi:release factor glutamine methyltransferase
MDARVAGGREDAVAPGATATADGWPSARQPQRTARDALRAAEARLADAGCDSPRLDAELLLADAVGADRDYVFRERDALLGAPAAERFERHLGRRERREPVAYVLGRRGFRRVELAVDPRVLVPRPETELVVEVALGVLAHGAHMHDVGTGSGAIALALKDERPDLEVIASDASEAALAVAAGNAARLGLDLALLPGRGLPAAAGRPDLVVANLPYVREDEWAGLAPEITRYEPAEALLGGGPDGLDAIRALVAGVPAGTRLVLEHAPAQAAAVRELLDAPQSFCGPGGGEEVTLGRAPAADDGRTRARARPRDRAPGPER